MIFCQFIYARVRVSSEENAPVSLFPEILDQHRFVELAAVRENDLFVVGRNGEIKQPAFFKIKYQYGFAAVNRLPPELGVPVLCKAKICCPPSSGRDFDKPEFSSA